MFFYIHIEHQSISVKQFKSFDEAFEELSKNAENDFEGRYRYDKDQFKELIRKYKYVDYCFGWYYPVGHIITDSSENIHPHHFNILKDFQ